MRKLFLVVLLGLSACVGVDETREGPIASAASLGQVDYRAAIEEWRYSFFADPYSLRSVAISEPRPWRNLSGVEGHLVCYRFNAKNRMGAYTGVRAVGFFIRDGVVYPPNRAGLLSTSCSWFT